MACASMSFGARSVITHVPFVGGGLTAIFAITGSAWDALRRMRQAQAACLLDWWVWECTMCMVWSCTDRLQRLGLRARGVTIEYQRSQAKAMQQYFRELNAQKAAEKAQCVARALEPCVLSPSLLGWVATLLSGRMLWCCL